MAFCKLYGTKSTAVPLTVDNYKSKDSEDSKLKLQEWPSELSDAFLKVDFGPGTRGATPL